MEKFDLAKINSILLRHFTDSPQMEVPESIESLPLMAANVKKQTRSFSRGQLVYIYNVYWGMNENALVVARFRRKYKWIRGVVPIKNLENFRPKIVYRPEALRKLVGQVVDRGIFVRFGVEIEGFDHLDDYIANLKGSRNINAIFERVRIWLCRLVGARRQ